jgi:hypothetical protein
MMVNGVEGYSEYSYMVPDIGTKCVVVFDLHSCLGNFSRIHEIYRSVLYMKEIIRSYGVWQVVNNQ